MNKFTETLIYIDEEEKDIEKLVSIFVLLESKLDILTISKMARKEGKTPRGIEISNNYRKEFIGGQKMAIKGLCENEISWL